MANYGINLKNAWNSYWNGFSHGTTSAGQGQLGQVSQLTSAAGSFTTSHPQNIGTSVGHIPNSNNTVGQLISTLTAAPVTITKEEHEELNKLEEQFQIETKQAKIDAFKALPIELRQHIANCIVWAEAEVKINKTEASVPERLKQLRIKLGCSFVGSLGRNSGWTNTTGSQNIFIGHQAGIANTVGVAAYNVTQGMTGLTTKEIIEAHLDACAEEALTELNK